MTETLFLIDTYSLLFQVFHAIPSMTSPKGLPTNAVFGFTRDLFNILTTQRPTYWLCALESPLPGTRETFYPQYKANRSEMPDDLRPQVSLIQQVMDGFGIPSLSCNGWEADDVIATVSRQAAERCVEVRIVTNDKDARQLLNPRVRIYNVRKNTWIDELELKNHWGIRPDQVIDFQALVGDSVDNVPGVPLIGPKKAATLLEEFGSLENVLANADKVAGAKLKANLKEFAEQARVSRQLVTLNQHLDVEPDWDSMRVGRVDVDRLTALFHEFGFRKFIDDAKSLPAEFKLSVAPSSTNQEGEAAASRLPARRCEIIESDEQFAAFLKQLRSQREFCLDVIASSPNPAEATIVGLTFAWDGDTTLFVPIDQSLASAQQIERAAETAIVKPPNRQQTLFDDEEDLSSNPSLSSALSRSNRLIDLKPILELPDVQIVNHELKFDLLLLSRAGIHVSGLGVDPMVASYLLEAGARSHDLPALADRFLHSTLAPFDVSMFGDRSRLVEWAAERANVAWDLSRQLAEDLRREGLWDLYWNLERPLIGVLAQMEATGIRIDVAELQHQSIEIGRRLTDLIAEIHQLAGHEFNIDSPKQLAKVLFEELQLPVMKKTKTGPSTDQDVLDKLALVHPLPAKIIEHRQLSKLKGTYLDALPAMVNTQTGKIHARFNQVVAATGRLSSSDPNLQNIPIRTTEGHRVRRAFIPSQPGWKLVCADYSQIELRMLAHFCGDPVLCEAFADGTDIHTAVACEIFNITPDDITSEQRRIAKAVNFGVLYGQSPFGLAETLHIDQAEATMFIDQYFAKYAAVDEYITHTLAEIARSGFATTIFGRRRAISGIRPERKRQLNLSERTAVNTVIQGSAADLIKQAMLKVHHRLAETRHAGRLLLQIHDELVFEAPAGEVASLATLVREEMTNAMHLRVPLVVDISMGDNWQELVTVD